jgi:DNA-binding beta-propeller fold protein YncE
MTPGVKSTANGMAVSRDGSTLVVSDSNGDSHSVSVYGVVDGVRKKVVGGPHYGSGPLQFNGPGQVCIADDDTVFVADCGNGRVVVLTPDLDSHAASLGDGQLSEPVGVCVSADIVVVSEAGANRLTVLKRSDGSVVRRMGCKGSGDGQLDGPQAVCFLSGGSHVAVADGDNDRVCIFGVADGAFVRHVGVGVLARPIGVACSPLGELVVADSKSKCVRLFSGSGQLLMTFGCGSYTGVAVHGGLVFAQSYRSEKCSLFS